MKKTFRKLIFGGLILTALILFVSCEKEQLNSDNAQYASILKVADDGVTTIIENNLKSALVNTADLSNEELAILLYTKEEEKLARDVYTVLYQKWGSSIFSRIALAEEKHMNAVITLLKYYGSADTLVGEPGAFSNTEIQSLYDDLIAKGSVSVEEAYKTGALIEEMDIHDLTEALAVIENENIILVFENLLKASRNHLRAFYRHLTNLELVYVPVYINQEEYDSIVNSPVEKGNMYRLQKQVNIDGDGNCYNYSNNDCNSDSNSYTNSYSNSYSNNYNNSDSNSYNNNYSNSYSNSYGDGQDSASCDTNQNSYGNTNAYGDTITNGNTNGNESGQENQNGGNGNG